MIDACERSRNRKDFTGQGAAIKMLKCKSDLLTLSEKAKKLSKIA